MTTDTTLNRSRESGWSPEELAAIREGLVLAVARLRSEISAVDSLVARALAQSTLDVLHDEIDVAAHREELLQDSVQAENAAAILEQTEHVLARLDAGLYGVCEECSGPIGRPRLEAFPRATLCMNCVR
jgi:DnaK suppressor protein